MTTRQSTEAATEPGDGHTHRWRIEAQGSATSAGVCDCGARKDFQNGWGHDSSSWMTSRKSPGPRSHN